LIRWPGRVRPGRASNEMVHQVDLFATLLGWTGGEVPSDRVIDGIDQAPFFEGEQETSNREGCLVWVRERLHAVKWRNFKVIYVRQRYFDEEARTLTNPHTVNLAIDPKERENYNQQLLHTWVPSHTGRLIQQFEASVKREPLIPAGAPVDYVPKPSA
jgi:arylsulfatase A-like enzyme